MKKNAEKGEVFKQHTEEEVKKKKKKYIEIYKDYVKSKTEGKQI